MDALGELQSVTLADGVESRLLEYMREAGLEPGDALPKEEEIAASLNVSRHIVREGVSRLKALGIVESRKRRGMVMKQPSAFAGLRKLAEADLFSGREREEFMELRVVLELGMCDFVFARKTPEALAQLRAVAGEPNSSMQRYLSEVDFHASLIEIGGNGIACQFREILVNVFKPIYEGKPWYGWKGRTPTHHEICDVLEHGTLSAFHAIMREHLAPYLDHIKTLAEKRG